MPPLGWETRTRRWELAPLLRWVSSPVTRPPQVSCHQFLPLALWGVVPGTAGLSSRARDFHLLAESLQ